MEDAARLDDSGEGSLERPLRPGQPLPPPRMDSYRLMRGSGTGSKGSRSGSGSEIYERLPADTGSLGDDLEDRLHLSCSEDEDSDMYILNQSNGDNRSGEHLVKPSQIKHKRPKAQPQPRHRPQPQQPPPGEIPFSG